MTESANTENHQENTHKSNIAEELLVKLRQKKGNWVEWGNAIAYLQKNGYNPQDIFEATGFEPIQQNQVVVGAQVYSSLEKFGASEATKAYYGTRASDILYELRLLTQGDRATAADLIFAHKLDVDEAREIAKAIKDFSRFSTPPEGFSTHPGDAVGYQCWKLARQNSDLQERSRLIAKGLRFVQSSTARKQIEQLLTDFTIVPQRNAPLLPYFRLESDEELPRLVPVVGELPLTPEDVKSVPLIIEEAPFNIVKFAGQQAWVALPGWQVLRSAEDPIVIIGESNIFFPQSKSSKTEQILIVIDRDQRDWDEGGYFAFDNDGEVDFQWFETQPEQTILGRIIVILRPKKVLDEDFTKDSWQIDE